MGTRIVLTRDMVREIMTEWERQTGTREIPPRELGRRLVQMIKDRAGAAGDDEVRIQ